MPNWIPLDDTNKQILYEGAWEVISGSTRQWEGGVSSTAQVGASCSLWFRGVGIVLRTTIPAGSSEQAFDYQIDDRPPVRVVNRQTSDNQYHVEVVRVEDLPPGVHKVTFRNVGSAPFQVDYMSYWPASGDANPLPIFPSDMTSSPPSITTASPLPPQVSPSPSTTVITRIIEDGQTKIITVTPPSDSVPNTAQARISSSSKSFPSQAALASLTSDSETVEDERVVRKVVAAFTERVVTVTDSNGALSTQTITVEEAAAAPGSTSFPLGAIIGIAVGGAIAVLAVTLVCVCWSRKRARKKRRSMLGGGVGVDSPTRISEFPLNHPAVSPRSMMRRPSYPFLGVGSEESGSGAYRKEIILPPVTTMSGWDGSSMYTSEVTSDPPPAYKDSYQSYGGQSTGGPMSMGR